MRILTILTATTYGLGSAVAHAGSTAPAPQEPIVTQPAPAPAPVRTGGDWGGFYGGVQLGFGDFDADGAGLNASDEGVVGGIHGGYNHDFGNFVLGGEAEIDGADVDFAGGGGVDTITRLKLRAGPDLGRTFLYGTVGAAYADGSAGGSGFSEWGYTAGAGLDYQLTPNWIIGGDVLYQEFEDVTPAGDDLDGTVVRARASYRF
ncbi:hypothetical protein DDZ14_06830 [Maritimibacter sp. 55A14]|uniref:outer membrane protein n=1 Tax=Maritimibacter sp. 55A14 TaxID=2174844 RepID=UPI000D6065C6|nr:outer membrane beta-barrel protein [Maritimibacter sp. 55A14]PWE33121.1 hypothetical protein DDZ14_06830 [Maritimibacter sp. 55A14]